MFLKTKYCSTINAKRKDALNNKNPIKLANIPTYKVRVTFLDRFGQQL